MDDSTICMSTLGRPFRLGMLYNRRNDELIAGITLWDKEKLEAKVHKSYQRNTKCEMVKEDSFAKKSALFELDENLKLSFITGMVNVGGSAKYLTDKKSLNTSRMSYTYKEEAYFEQLGMEHLAKGALQHHDVFAQTEATHVVTGILYGANAVFVIDRRGLEGEVESKVHEEMGVVAKLFINAGKKQDNTGEWKIKGDRLSVTFHGDFQLSSNPTTVEDALKIFKDLPKKLKEKEEDAIPIKAWLYPLKKLDSRASYISREISEDAVNQTSNIMECLSNCAIACSDLLKNPICTKFRTMKRNLSEFAGLLDRYQSQFKGALLPVLSKIRGGKAEELALLQVLAKSRDSPFYHIKLKNWLDSCEKEISVLNMYLKMIGDVEFISGTTGMEQVRIENEEIAALVFDYKTNRASILANMKQYIDDSSTTLQMEEEDKPWYEDDSKKREMRENIKGFRDYIKNNKSEDIKFIATAVEEEDCATTKSTIILIKNDIRIEENFIPPSPPRNLVITNCGHDSIYLTWSQPASGGDFVKEYMIKIRSQDEMRVMKVAVEKGAKVKDTYTTVVSGLEPESVYWLSIVGICTIGKTDSSAEVEGRTGEFMVTNLDAKETLRMEDDDLDIGVISCFPPTEPRNLVISNVSHDEITLEWSKPSKGSAFVKEYDVLCCMSIPGGHEEMISLNCPKEDNSKTYKTVVTDLEPYTEYIIQVVCRDIEGIKPKTKKKKVPTATLR